MIDFFHWKIRVTRRNKETDKLIDACIESSLLVYSTNDYNGQSQAGLLLKARSFLWLSHMYAGPPKPWVIF